MMMRFARFAAKAVAWLLLPLCLYAGATLALGLLPVNRDFRQADSGIDIYLRADAVHTDLLLPASSGLHDWRALFKLPGIEQAPYLSIGWGDRAFYLETKTWADLRAGNALRALVGLDGTLLHVAAEARPRESADIVRIRVTPDQLRRLVAQIDASLLRDANGLALPVTGAHYAANDGFFEARGHYSMLTTCNEWVRTVLSGAGVRTARWAPLAVALRYQAQQIEDGKR